MDKQSYSTEYILGKQVLQVCHNLRSPISQFITASVIGTRLTNDQPDINRLFEIISQAAHLFADTITCIEQRVTYQNEALSQRVDLVVFMRQQILFFEFEERMRYKTKCTFTSDTEPLPVSIVPSDFLQIISSIFYYLFDRVDHAVRGTLDIHAHGNTSLAQIRFTQRCELIDTDALSHERSGVAMIENLQSLLQMNHMKMTIDDEAPQSVSINLDLPLAS